MKCQCGRDGSRAGDLERARDPALAKHEVCSLFTPTPTMTATFPFSMNGLCLLLTMNPWSSSSLWDARTWVRTQIYTCNMHASNTGAVLSLNQMSPYQSKSGIWPFWLTWSLTNIPYLEINPNSWVSRAKSCDAKLKDLKFFRWHFPCFVNPKDGRRKITVPNHHGHIN